MRRLPLLAAFLLVTCVRSHAPHPAPQQYDKTIVFPKSLSSGEVLLPQSNQTLAIDGARVQAIMVAAQDFISTESSGLSCWNKPGDFHYRVLRQDDIFFVEISADQSACNGIGALDFGARYAISTDGRILRRLDATEPDWAAPSEVHEPGDGGMSRKYDLEELVPMISGPMDDSLTLDGGIPYGGGLLDGGSAPTQPQ